MGKKLKHSTLFLLSFLSLTECGMQSHFSAMNTQDSSTTNNNPINPAGNAPTTTTNPTGNAGASSTQTTTQTNSTHSSMPLAEAVVRVTNNVYSPSLIIQGGTLVMYYGGWDNPGQTHDNIYRVECHAELTCDAAGALLLDSQALGFEHLNDPSVVVMPDGYYLMYMTGVYAGLGGSQPASVNHVFWSVSSDAINWTQPSLIADDIWLPSATLDANNNVLLYGNSTADGSLIQYNLGPSGVVVQSRTPVSTPFGYVNVNVVYRPDLGHFQIFGETFGDNNQIDFLNSGDGLHWHVEVPAVVTPHEGFIHVRTPTAHPSTNRILYYSESADPNSMGNQIESIHWKEQ